MMRKFIEPALLGLLLLGLAVFAGSQLVVRNGAAVEKKMTYSTDLNDLRAQFNQDKGKVRLVMVLSPT